jgi:putative membrane protein
VNNALIVPLADTWDMHGDFSGGWWIPMMVFMVLFWAAIILGIVWLVRGASGGWRWGGERKETPSEILERRFAEGAISVEDYYERREVIAAGGRPRQGAAGDDESAAPGRTGRAES